MSGKPFAMELSNPGHDDRWTCPGCYADLPNRRTATVTCQSCDRTVVCTLDSQPVCVATLVDVGDDVEEE